MPLRRISRRLFRIAFWSVGFVVALSLKHKWQRLKKYGVTYDEQEGATAAAGEKEDLSVEFLRVASGRRGRRRWTESRFPLRRRRGPDDDGGDIDGLPPGVRIAFRVRDPDDAPRVPDAKCLNTKRRAREVPPNLVDARSARRWEREREQVQRSAGRGINSTATHTAEEKEGGNKEPILDFVATVATDLQIFFLGDSIAEQFAQGFESAVGARTNDPDGVNTIPDPAHWSVLESSPVKKNVCSSEAAPVRGGGAVGLLRVTELLHRNNEGKKTCEHFGGGWNHGQVGNLLNYEYAKSGLGEAKTNETATAVSARRKVGYYDVVVLRIPHGWMRPPQITRERIVETLRLCGELFGAETVVIMTLHFSNNVRNPDEWKWAAGINEMVRDIARTWTEHALDVGVRNVLVQEFSNYTTQVHWASARAMGGGAYPDLPAPDPSVPNWDQVTANNPHPSFLFDRFKSNGKYDKFPRSIPVVCANATTVDENENRSCPYNAISRDGMHFCMTAIGARYHASVACLLGCIYNGRRLPESAGKNVTGGDGDSRGREIRGCERMCNDRFMSLLPLKSSWLGLDTTLFSAAGDEIY